MQSEEMHKSIKSNNDINLKRQKCDSYLCATLEN